MTDGERAARVRGRRTAGVWQAFIVMTLGLCSVAARTPFQAPPRFDGAGYAVLAESLLRGEGYRAIDHPDRPRHGHYPPGYPLVLAGIWRLTGISHVAAHALSVVCTATAVAWFHHWLKRRAPAGVAFTLALALAVNWAWGRAGGSIQSEPLFFLMTALALNALDWSVRGSWPRALALGAVLGATILTRHVGAMISISLVAELLARRRFAPALAASAVALLVVAPWAAWVASVSVGAQYHLIGRGGLGSLLARQARFYLERIPDQITGPAVEVGTVFRPEFQGLAWTWSLLASAFVVAGWLRQLRRARWRVAALVPAATLALLLAWPFTEAGRFLVPLVPFLLLGGAWGLAGALRLRRTPARRCLTLGALAILAVSIPYSAYALLRGRHVESERMHLDFDNACAWVGSQPGNRPVLVRQSGEAYWLMRRTRPALSPAPAATPDEIERTIKRYQIEFLVLDAGRYAHDPAHTLGHYVDERPGAVERAFSSGPVSVYRIRTP
jgi:hypothetical protein